MSRRVSKALVKLLSLLDLHRGGLAEWFLLERGELTPDEKRRFPVLMRELVGLGLVERVSAASNSERVEHVEYFISEKGIEVLAGKGAA